MAPIFFVVLAGVVGGLAFAYVSFEDEAIAERARSCRMSFLQGTGVH